VTNVLFLTTYTGIGGGESLQLNLMRALTERYTLHLLTPREGAFPEKAAELGVKTHVIAYRGTSTFFVPALWSKFPITAKLRNFLHDQQIQVVMSDYHTLPFLIPAAQSLNIPVIWNAMGWWFPIYPWQRQFFEQRIQKIIAITGAVKDRLLHNPPVISPSRIDVLIPGVDPAVHHPGVDGSPVRAKLGIGPEIPLVAMVARFQNVKGHEYFLEAARYILAEMPEVRFAVAGENVFAVSKDETYKQSILQMVQNDPLLKDRVTYLGFWPDAREVLAAADVMVCSSWFESLSMVALESMSMERPIVSTSVGGPTETLIDGVTGYLVPPRDSSAIANRVVKLLKDPVLRQQMGKAGRAHVTEHFSAASYAAKISAMIDQLVPS
jgi:glycosyltransferase involved in cell wall biosynthesis